MSERLAARRGLPAIFGIALATGFSGAVVPGPLLTVVVTESVRRGWWAGPVMMAGHGTLELIAILLLITGLIRFARSPRVQGVVGLIGGVVLLYLAYGTLMLSGESGAGALRAQAAAGAAAGGWPRLVWLGGLMSAVNPYWWLWWATVGAAHTSWAVQRERVGGATYFVGHVMSDVIWYSAVSVALGAGRTLLSPSALRGIYIVCGAFLLGLGVAFGVAGARRLARAQQGDREHSAAGESDGRET